MPIRVLAICGSLRKASFNRFALDALAEIAAPDLTVDIRFLGDIPMFNQDLVDAGGVPAVVAAFRAEIAGADAVIIATPEYSHSVSGVLKNALDWTHGKDSPFIAKPVGLVSASTSPLGGSRAQYDLREILQSVSANVMPMPEMFIGGAGKKFDASGTLIDEATRASLAAFTLAFGAWIRRVRPE